MSDFEYLNEPGVKDSIQENIQSDIQKLLLNPPSKFRDHIREIVGQIQARQKAKGKLDTWVNNPDLIFPPPLSVEQSSSEKAAAYKKGIISGNHLIDLTGGMGIDCLTLSENFQRTTYVEMQPDLAEVFKHNSTVLGTKVEVVNQLADDYLGQIKDDGLTVFIDPARRDDGKNRVFKLEDCSPDLRVLLPKLQTKANQVLVKLSPLLEIKSVLEVLGNVKEVHVVSIRNECKELLFLIDFSFEGPALIKTINLEDSNQTYDFFYSEEESSHSEYKDVNRFVMESNTSILKSGAFKKVGTDYGVGKIHPNTHLYTSDRKTSNWPGRTFEVIESNVTKKHLSKFAPKGFINIITRNYPMNAQALKAKFKVNDGGDYFLIGFRDRDEKARLVIGKRC